MRRPTPPPAAVTPAAATPRAPMAPTPTAADPVAETARPHFARSDGDAVERAAAGDAPTDAPPTKPAMEPKCLKIATAADTGITTFTLHRTPGNSFSLELFGEINEWLLWLSYDAACKSVVITSETANIFCAGLDINELHNAQPERFGQFWTGLQQMWTLINSFPKPIVAAITGHAPAGGCVIANCCDYRVMARAPAGKPEKLFRVGLNETALGIVAPPWVAKNMSHWVGTRKADIMLQRGDLVTADEALAINLVDEVVATPAEVKPAAELIAAKLMAMPHEARWMSKTMMRRDMLGLLETDEQRRYDTAFYTRLLQNEDVQKNISDYLAALKAKKQ
jgi:3,2-trans-enoyl-CoA isomerase